MPTVKKSPQAFRTISEVAHWLGTPTHVLRFWESRFSEIAPVKGAGGRRYYRPQDMQLLGGIKQLLHTDGRTIKSVQELLAKEGIEAVRAFCPAAPNDTAPAPETGPAPAPQPEMSSVAMVEAARGDRPPIGYFFDDNVQPVAEHSAAAAVVEPTPQQSQIRTREDLPADPQDPRGLSIPTLAAELRARSPSDPAIAKARDRIRDLAARLNSLCSRA